MSQIRNKLLDGWMCQNHGVQSAVAQIFGRDGLLRIEACGPTMSQTDATTQQHTHYSENVVGRYWLCAVSRK